MVDVGAPPRRGPSRRPCGAARQAGRRVDHGGRVGRPAGHHRLRGRLRRLHARGTTPRLTSVVSSRGHVAAPLHLARFHARHRCGGRGRGPRRRPRRARRRDGRGEDRVRAGLRRGARRDRSDHLADVHDRAQLPDRQADVPPRGPLPPQHAARGRRPGAARSSPSPTGSCSSSGATWWRPASATTSRSGSSSDPSDEEARHLTVHPVGRAWMRRWERVGSGRGGFHVLILGIETATEQVSVAIGGHEGVLGMFEVCRGRRHAETLTPAIEFVCRQADVELAEIGADRRRCRSGAVHRDARRARRRQGAGARAAHPDDRHGLARPARVPAAPQRSHGRGGDRRAQGRGVLRASTGRCPEACSASPSRGAARWTTSSPTCSRCPDEVLFVGDGALRYRDDIGSDVHGEFADQFLSRPSAAPLVQLAHARGAARGVGEPVGDPTAVPARARRADQLVDARGERPAGAAGVSVLSRFLRRPAGAATVPRSTSSRCAVATSSTSNRSSWPRTRGRGR